MKAVTNPEPGYAFEAEEKAYLDELDRLRQEAGLGKADRVADAVDQGIVVQANERVAAGSPHAEEMQNLLGHFSKKTGIPFTAHTFVLPQLDGWRPEYDADLLSRPRMGVVVNIMHIDQQYVVTVLFGDLDFTP